MAELQTPEIEPFRVQFPAFADMVKYPDATIKGIFDRAACIIKLNAGCGCGAVLPCRLHALYLLSAHILALSEQAAKAQQGQNVAGFATSASIDKVSVSIAPPPVKNGFQYWLSTTPYGLELWALLSQKSGFGIYYGGQFEQVFR